MNTKSDKAPFNKRVRRSRRTLTYWLQTKLLPRRLRGFVKLFVLHLQSGQMSRAQVLYQEAHSRFGQEFTLNDRVVSALSFNCQKSSIEEFQPFYPKNIKPHLSIWGDSHVEPLFLNWESFASRNLTADIYIMGGSTISGFGKRKSTHNTLEKIDKYIFHLQPTHLILKFGQVDVDLGFYYRATIKDQYLDYRKFYTTIIDRYLTSIQGIRDKTELIVAGINLPTLKRQEDSVLYTQRIITENIHAPREKQRYLDKLTGLMPDFEERTEMSRQFNRLMQKRCEEQGITFLDLNSLFYAPGENQVDDKYLVSNDHHYITSKQDRERVIAEVLHRFGIDKQAAND